MMGPVPENLNKGGARPGVGAKAPAHGAGRALPGGARRADRTSEARD